MVRPPSTNKIWPVIQPDSADRRKASIEARFSGSLSRGSAVFSWEFPGSGNGRARTGLCAPGAVCARGGLPSGTASNEIAGIRPRRATSGHTASPAVAAVASADEDRVVAGGAAWFGGQEAVYGSPKELNSPPRSGKENFDPERGGGFSGRQMSAAQLGGDAAARASAQLRASIASRTANSAWSTTHKA
jgi:hypothetical protein